MSVSVSGGRNPAWGIDQSPNHVFQPLSPIGIQQSRRLVPKTSYLCLLFTQHVRLSIHVVRQTDVFFSHSRSCLWMGQFSPWNHPLLIPTNEKRHIKLTLFHKRLAGEQPH